jgi:hypothetical protein
LSVFGGKKDMSKKEKRRGQGENQAYLSVVCARSIRADRTLSIPYVARYGFSIA